MNFVTTLNQLIERENLSADTADSLMRDVMTGKLDTAQIASLLIALRMKGETVEEISACAKVMRELAHKVDIENTNLIDIVGTGGDGQSTFNVSTCVSFVVAAAGGIVAKHGNRSVSSKSGSADLLEHAGININLNASQVNQCIKQCGIGFMFAPAHHPAMKHALETRKSLGVRTVFNLLGPLTNPAGAQYQVIGVFSKKWLIPITNVLAKLGSTRAIVVHSEDGLDEISIASPTFVVEFNQGQFKEYTINPTDYGIFHQNLDGLRVTNVAQSLEIVMGVFNNQKGPAFDIVVLNAACALYCLSLTQDFNDAITLANKTLTSGAALAKFNLLKKVSNSF
jgi:anthranilate phosphoribosyltransferase